MKKYVELDSIILGGQWQICVRFKFNHDLITVAKSLRMRYDKRYKFWHIYETKYNKQSIITEFGKHATVIASDMTFAVNKLPTTKERVKLDLQLNDLAQMHMKRFDGMLANKRYSSHTRTSYISVLQKFFSFYSDMDPLQLTMDELGKFNNDYIIENNYSVNTQRQLISAIKLFYANTSDHNMRIESMVRPKKSRKIPVILEKHEIKEMIDSTANIKHKTIISALYATGMRRSELLNLKMIDIQRENMYISIKDAKGRKDRNVPLSHQLLILLRKYYKMYRPAKYMFEGSVGMKYSSASVNNIIKASAKRARINKNVTCHTLRHSYATHLLDKGVNLRYIQELLGHSSPKTTEIYTYVRPDYITRVQSPLDDFDNIALENEPHYATSHN